MPEFCHDLITKFFFVFGILVLLAAGFVWQGIFLPLNANSFEEKVFSVEGGQGLFQVAENLEKQDLIKSRFFLDFYAILKGKQKKLQAGDYLLSFSMNIPEIVQKIVSGDIHTIKITIPEGYNIEQIDARLSEVGLIEKGEIVDLELEGFLFPDTYYFSPSARVDEIVKAFLHNFDQKLTPELREEIQEQNKTIFEIIIIASLIEKEVKTIGDKKLVSGILWKRLKAGIPLQVDAAISYITGKRTTKISKEETQIDSPYNTYKYSGLPKGPICNPGLDSIIAAIYPQNSDYWYYLSTPEGETIFSKTLEEHNIAKAKHLW